MRVLVTGATGYIGGRLVPCLLRAGHGVRCLVRRPDGLAGRPWETSVDVVVGDALRPETLGAAVEGIDVAYYLIHSLASGEERFAERDRRAAEAFGAACKAAGVARIVYLGGIEPKGAERSAHLESRLETGDVLRASGVPVTEFRAAVIVGSGSLSFELIRYLTERIPVLISPRWVRTPTQPIGVRDVIAYLVETLGRPETAGRTYEIGGTDVLTYADMFRIYAAVRGLWRPIIPVPVLTPALSARWVGLVTPVPSRIARPLIKGLSSEVVVTDDAAMHAFSVRPMSYEAAVRLALGRVHDDEVETVWFGAASSSAPDWTVQRKLSDEQGMLQDRQRVRVRAEAATVFRVVSEIGGANGWLYAQPLWRLRGLLDRMVGGVGLRRGRRSNKSLLVGEAVDFWRVEALEPDRLLRLRAEMKLPGKAWLQFEVKPAEGAPTESDLAQTAFYEPKGLLGLAYWYSVLPAHAFVFPGMVREVARRAEALQVRLDSAREQAVRTAVSA